MMAMPRLLMTQTSIENADEEEEDGPASSREKDVTPRMDGYACTGSGARDVNEWKVRTPSMQKECVCRVSDERTRECTARRAREDERECECGHGCDAIDRLAIWDWSELAHVVQGDSLCHKPSAGLD